MNKTELIQAVSEKAEVSKKEATKIVEATFESITEALQNGEKIQLIGFGTFEVRERAAVKVATHVRKKISKFQRAKFLHLKQVKRSRTRSSNQHYISRRKAAFFILQASSHGVNVTKMCYTMSE